MSIHAPSEAVKPALVGSDAARLLEEAVKKIARREIEKAFAQMTLSGHDIALANKNGQSHSADGATDQVEQDEAVHSVGWVSNARAMELLGVSRATLQRWRTGGKLPYAKVAGLLFYRIADIDALLGAHVVQESKPLTDSQH